MLMEAETISGEEMEAYLKGESGALGGARAAGQAGVGQGKEDEAASEQGEATSGQGGGDEATSEHGGKELPPDDQPEAVAA